MTNRITFVLLRLLSAAQLAVPQPAAASHSSSAVRGREQPTSIWAKNPNQRQRGLARRARRVSAARDQWRTGELASYGGRVDYEYFQVEENPPRIRTRPPARWRCVRRIAGGVFQPRPGAIRPERRAGRVYSYRDTGTVLSL